MFTKLLRIKDWYSFKLYVYLSFKNFKKRFRITTLLLKIGLFFIALHNQLSGWKRSSSPSKPQQSSSSPTPQLQSDYWQERWKTDYWYPGSPVYNYYQKRRSEKSLSMRLKDCGIKEETKGERMVRLVNKLDVANLDLPLIHRPINKQ